jgi:cell division protein FtsN
LRGAVSALSGGAILQIGAYRSSAVATQAWQDFLVEHRDVVGDLVSDIQEADLGASGVWHRLRIGPFADRDAASAMCATLKTQGADCFVVVP